MKRAGELIDVVDPKLRRFFQPAEVHQPAPAAGALMEYFYGTKPKLAPGLGTRRRRYKKGTKGYKKAKYQCHDLQGEKNYFDSLVTGADIDNTPVIDPLNIIPVGSAVEQRLGRRVQMASAYIRCNVIPPVVSSGNSPIICRFMLIYDKQTNGALPAGTDFLDAATVHSQLNMENRARFEVLLDKTITLNTTAGVGDGTTNFWAVQGLFWKKFIKLHRRDVIYGSSVPSIADIATGGLYFFFLSNKAAGVLAPTADYEIRVRYYS